MHLSAMSVIGVWDHLEPIRHTSACTHTARVRGWMPAFVHVRNKSLLQPPHDGDTFCCSYRTQGQKHPQWTHALPSFELCMSHMTHEAALERLHTTLYKPPALCQSTRRIYISSGWRGKLKHNDAEHTRDVNLIVATA